MTATHPTSGVAVEPEPIDARLAQRAASITERELKAYAERTAGSQRATQRARKVLPLGVPSSFQAYDPHPIVVKHASGARMIDVDDHEYVDYDMGFGALFAGHMHPAVRSAVEAQLDDGTLFVSPCEANAEVAELLRDRYRLPMWRFTNSGTEATMDAIRLARGVTGRHRLAKVEGGYHGHHDEVMISMKPPLDLAGPADAPLSVPGTEGLSPDIIAGTAVVPVQRPRRPRAGARQRRHRVLHRRAGDGEHRHLPARRGLPAGRPRPDRRNTARCSSSTRSRPASPPASVAPAATSGSSPIS